MDQKGSWWETYAEAVVAVIGWMVVWIVGLFIAILEGSMKQTGHKR